MTDDGGVGDEELSVQLDVAGVVAGVEPGVLAAVVVGVLCSIALLFALACYMDRWNKKAKPGRSTWGSSQQSTKITILDDMSPNPVSDAPADSVSGATN